VVCAQRTSFARIYGMMRKLAETLGEPTAETVDGATVYAFPTPAQMAEASDEQLRACSVGFRAKGLASVAAYLAESGYTWQDWKTCEPAEVIPDLLDIKGVGPYTANLAVNLTYGRGGTAHVDTYVTNVIGTLYLDNPNASPEQVAQFIDQTWGAHGDAVLDLLTTDTEVWTAELGITVGVRSGARA
jgi:N-glycosylase/DNA lyase